MRLHRAATEQLEVRRHDIRQVLHRNDLLLRQHFGSGRPECERPMNSSCHPKRNCERRLAAVLLEGAGQMSLKDLRQRCAGHREEG